VYLIIPLRRHPNAGDGLTVAWQDPTTHDAVLTASDGFIATVGVTGAAFADLFETEDAARDALIEHRAHGFTLLRK
jgi:hypothetical protein